MKYYAVIDTNVLVSSLLTSNSDSPVVQVVNAVRSNEIIPMYNDVILEEYTEVLHREKFGFDNSTVEDMLSMIKNRGINCERKPVSEFLPDADDVVFYEVAMSREYSYLVTGNLKHFPKNGHVVSPADMMLIIELGIIRPEILSEPDSLPYMSIPLGDINAIIMETRLRLRSHIEESGRV